MSRFGGERVYSKEDASGKIIIGKALPIIRNLKKIFTRASRTPSVIKTKNRCPEASHDAWAPDLGCGLNSLFCQKFKFSYSSVRIVIVDSPKVFVRYKWVIVSFFLIQRIQIFEKMKIEKNWKIIEIYILFIYLLEMEELQQINWSCIEITKTKKRFIGTVKGPSGLGLAHNGRIRAGSK